MNVRILRHKDIKVEESETKRTLSCRKILSNRNVLTYMHVIIHIYVYNKLASSEKCYDSCSCDWFISIYY